MYIYAVDNEHKMFHIPRSIRDRSVLSVLLSLLSSLAVWKSLVLRQIAVKEQCLFSSQHCLPRVIHDPQHQ